MTKDKDKYEHGLQFCLLDLKAMINYYGASTILNRLDPATKAQIIDWAMSPKPKEVCALVSKL